MAKIADAQAMREALRLLAALLDGADLSHFLEIRAIGGELQSPSQWFIPVGGLQRSGLPSDVMALDGVTNVYYSVVPRVRPGGKSIDCAPALALWADFDDGKPTGVPLAPSLVTESSPGKYQALWLLDSSCADLAAVVAVNNGIARGYGADLNACDQARVLRLPGFANLKYTERPRARLLVYEPTRRYPLSDLAEAFPPATIPTSLSGRPRVISTAPAWLQLVYGAIVDYLNAHGLRWRPNRDGILAQCPFHDDREPSLSLHPVRGWKCFAGCGHGRLTLLAARLGVRVPVGGPL